MNKAALAVADAARRSMRVLRPYHTRSGVIDARVLRPPRTIGIDRILRHARGNPSRRSDAGSTVRHDGHVSHEGSSLRRDGSQSKHRAGARDAGRRAGADRAARWASAGIWAGGVIRARASSPGARARLRLSDTDPAAAWGAGKDADKAPHLPHFGGKLPFENIGRRRGTGAHDRRHGHSGETYDLVGPDRGHRAEHRRDVERGPRPRGALRRRRPRRLGGAEPPLRRRSPTTSA